MRLRTRAAMVAVLACLLIPAAVGNRPAPATRLDIEASNPWRRAQWAYEIRAFPADHIPVEAIPAAMDEIRAARVRRPAARTAAAWESIGPTPIDNKTDNPFLDKTALSGRVSAIAVDPKKSKHWLAGGAQGGIWESNNKGKSWTPRTDDAAKLSIGAIAFARSNTKIVYAGTGEAVFSGDAYGGIGVLKSTNGGKTWKQINQTNLTGLAFSDILVHPTDPDTVIAATARGTNRPTAFQATAGVYRSTDGGVTWALVRTGSATDLEVSSRNFNVMYAGVGEIFGAFSNGLYRSTDAGQTWAKIAGPWDSGSPGRMELALAPSDPDTLYVGVQDASTFLLQGLWETGNASASGRDRAPSFTAINIPAIGGSSDYCESQCWYDHVLTVDPKKSHVLYAGGVYLWKRTGTNWTRLLPGHVDQQSHAWSGKTLIMGNDGGVFSSKNGGNSWKSHNKTLTLTQFYHGAIHPDDLDTALGGSQDNGTVARDGGSFRAAGDTWDFVFGGDGAGTSIANDNPATHWIVSFQDSGVVRTKNGGASFILNNAGVNTAAGPFIGEIAMCQSDDDAVILGTDRVWRTNNFFSSPGQSSWKDQGPNGLDGEVITLAFAAGDKKCKTAAIGTSAGEIYVTKNGGKKWRNADPKKQVPDRAVTKVAFDANNKKELWVTLSGFNENTPGDGHVFRTTNATAGKPSWKNQSTPVNIPHNVIVIQPGNPNKAWVGTDIGVWEQVGAARGIEWVHHGAAEGLPNVAVFDLRATKQGVVAFTHGRGAFVLEQKATRPRR